MLEPIFIGPQSTVEGPHVLSELEWTMDEQKSVVAKLKSNKVPHEASVVAELLKHVPEYFLQTLVTIYNDVLRSGSEILEGYSFDNAS